ncbi:MAG: ABC transporter ATP-binding protein [Chloroflexi bacterium]|nr:ABC transporter ATP-binding protein [Chloroflexota bacterium]
MLEIKNLTVGLPSRAESGFDTMLEDVSLSVEAGQSLGLVGEAGSGKSLLVHAIGGLLRPPVVPIGGEILFEGQDLLSMPPDDRRLILGEELSLVLPGGRIRLNPLEKVGRQIVRVLRDHHPEMAKAEALERAIQLLDRVGIPDPDKRALAYPHELSGGMAQRTVVAMALANSPRFIVADEPTTGIDVTIQRQILEDFAGLIREDNVGLLIVTRDLGIVAHFCDRVAVVSEGRIVENAEVRTFFKEQQHPVSQELMRATVLERQKAAEWSAAAASR